MSNTIVTGPNTRTESASAGGLIPPPVTADALRTQAGERITEIEFQIETCQKSRAAANEKIRELRAELVGLAYIVRPRRKRKAK